MKQNSVTAELLQIKNKLIDNWLFSDISERVFLLYQSDKYRKVLCLQICSLREMEPPAVHVMSISVLYSQTGENLNISIKFIICQSCEFLSFCNYFSLWIDFDLFSTLQQNYYSFTDRKLLLTIVP